MCLSGAPHHTKCLSLVVKKFSIYKHVLNILQVVSFGTLLSYPSLAQGGWGTKMCLSGVPHHPKCLSLVVCDTLVCTQQFQ